MSQRRRSRDAESHSVRTGNAAVGDLNICLPNGSSNGPAMPYIVQMYMYRHLLRNFDNEYRDKKNLEKKEAPAINGPRVGAVLARLWADAQLGQEPSSQKSYAIDLGIDQGGIGTMLHELEGAGCVKLVSDPRGLENLYEITEKGKEQIEKWVVIHYTDKFFADLIQELSPNRKKLARAVERYVERCKEQLHLK